VQLAEKRGESSPSFRPLEKAKKTVADDEAEEEAVKLPLDGRLDLHLFRPEEVEALLDAYLAECRAAGVLDIEVVHGKGIGVLRRRVLALLSKRDDIEWLRAAEEARGGWGVTLLRLRPKVAPTP